MNGIHIQEKANKYKHVQHFVSASLANWLRNTQIERINISRAEYFEHNLTPYIVVSKRLLEYPEFDFFFLLAHEVNFSGKLMKTKQKMSGHGFHSRKSRRLKTRGDCVDERKSSSWFGHNDEWKRQRKREWKAEVEL